MRRFPLITGAQLKRPPISYLACPDHRCAMGRAAGSHSPRTGMHDGKKRTFGSTRNARGYSGLSNLPPHLRSSAGRFDCKSTRGSDSCKQVSRPATPFPSRVTLERAAARSRSSVSGRCPSHTDRWSRARMRSDRVSPRRTHGRSGRGASVQVARAAPLPANISTDPAPVKCRCSPIVRWLGQPSGTIPLWSFPLPPAVPPPCASRLNSLAITISVRALSSPRFLEVEHQLGAIGPTTCFF